MNNNSIFVTDACSSDCSHCPYRSGQMQKGHLPIHEVISKLDHTAMYHIVTGGEPLLYPFLLDLLEYFEEKGLYWRIATGGGENLNELIKYTNLKKFFLGFALGTDILVKSKSALRQNIWRNNLNILEENKCQYSLTFTVSNKSILNSILKKLSPNISLKFAILAEEFGTLIDLDEWELLKSKIRSKFKIQAVHDGYRN
jgi:MoaA/NifB/PqqE/SkfB family radical SAM enzyme